MHCQLYIIRFLILQFFLRGVLPPHYYRWLCMLRDLKNEAILAIDTVPVLLLLSLWKENANGALIGNSSVKKVYRCFQSPAYKGP